MKAFSDELEKIALRLKGVHGSYHPWDVLKGGVGKLNMPSDPNPRALYMAGQGGKKIKGLVQEFAERAVATQGKGKAVVTRAVMNTKKGWKPRALSVYGKKHIGTVEDALDLIDDIDSGVLTAKEKGEAYMKLNRGVGSWWNPENPGSTLKPIKWKSF